MLKISVDMHTRFHILGIIVGLVDSYRTPDILKRSSPHVQGKIQRQLHLVKTIYNGHLDTGIRNSERDSTKHRSLFRAKV